MVTRKTRLASAFAAVLMLVSMLAVFVIPASASQWAADEAVQSSGLKNVASLPDVSNYSTPGEYKVTNRAGMDKIMDLVAAGTGFSGSTIYMANDIDMGWEPFGGIGGIMQVGQNANQSLPFKGTFDGNGFTIDNLYVLRNTDVANSVGLFGLVEEATIRNVGVSGGLVAGRADVGTIVGSAIDSRIHNCWSAATVIGGNTVANGGIVGRISGDLMEVVNCYNLGLVFNHSKYATGIVGYAENAVEAVIANCYNAGEIVTGMNGYGEAAAPGLLEAYSIVMGADYQMENCINNANNYYIKGRGKVRSVAELIIKNNGSFSDMAETIIMSTDAAAGMEATALTDGSLVAALNSGDMTLAPVDGYTVAFENTQAGYPAIAYKKNGNTVVKRVAHNSFNVNGKNDWAEKSELFAYLLENRDGGWAKASSSRLDNLEIDSANDLFVLGLISSFCTYKTVYGNGNITLTADIDMSEMDLCPVQYFVPIASGTGYFNGVFDGRNHVIKGWKFWAAMCGGAPNGGLISRVGPATIKNLGMLDAYGLFEVEAIAGGYSYPALLVEREYAGPNYIDNCYVVGTLDVRTGATNHNNNGAVFSTTWGADDLYITNCWSQVKLTGASNGSVRCIGKIPAATVTCPSSNNYSLVDSKPQIGDESTDNGANRIQTQLMTTEYSRADGSLAALLNSVMVQKWTVTGNHTTFAASANQGSYSVTIQKMVGDFVLESESFVYTAGDTVTVPTIEGYVLDSNKPQPIGALQGSFVMPAESVILYYQKTTADFSLLEDIIEKYGDFNMDLLTDGKPIRDIVNRAQEVLDAKNLIPEERAKELIAEIMNDSENLVVELKDYYPYLVPLTDYEIYKDIKKNNEWAITTLADWQKAVQMSRSQSFAGWTLHFTNDIDFENVLVEPLSINTSPSFKGVIDGHGYVIKNLNINWDLARGNYAGLIGYANGATIKNLGISGGSVIASGSQNSNEAKVGGFVGEGDSTSLYNLWADITVDTSGGNNSGGQTTSGIARVRSKSFIENCYFIGTVKGKGYTGTVSGYVQGETLVKNCFSVGTGQGGTPVFVRYSNSNVTTLTKNSYAVNNAGYYDSYMPDYNPVENNITMEQYSNGELAWMLNKNYVEGNAERAYYTLKDDKTVFGTAANQTVKVTLTMEGEPSVEMYVNAGTNLKLDYAAGATYTLAAGSEGTINGDILIVPGSDVTVVAVTSGLKLRSLATALEQYDEVIFNHIVDGAAVKAKVEAIREKYETLSYETQEEVDADVAYLNSAMVFGAAPLLPPVTMVEKFPDSDGYMVNTLSDLNFVASNKIKFTAGKTIYLNADITVTADSNANSMNGLKANIDGMGHAIKNVTFAGTSSWLGTYSGSIKNLVVDSWTCTNLPWQGAALVYENTGNLYFENIKVINSKIVSDTTTNGLSIILGVQRGTNDAHVEFKNISVVGCQFDCNNRAGNAGVIAGRIQRGSMVAENIYIANNTFLNGYGGGCAIAFGELTGSEMTVKNMGVYNNVTGAETGYVGVLGGNFKKGDEAGDPAEPKLVLENIQVANNGSIPRLVYRQNTNSRLETSNIYSDVEFGTGVTLELYNAQDILNGLTAYDANKSGVSAKWEILPGQYPSIDTDGKGLPVKVALTTEFNAINLVTDTEGHVIGLTEEIFNSAQWDGYETIDALKAAVFTEDTVINTRPCEHDWTFVDNKNGTHTMTCHAVGGCGAVQTVPCNYEYSFAGNKLHSKTCADCGNNVVEACLEEIIYVEADCDTPKQTLRGCKLCKTFDVLSTGSTLGGHIWSCTHTEGTEGAASTHTCVCVREGVDCDETTVENCVFGNGVYTPHTKDAKGYTTYTCDECGYSYKVEDAEFEHEWNEENVKIALYPTYITENMTEEMKESCKGIAHVFCDCGAYTEVEIPALTGAGIQVNVPGSVEVGETIDVTLDLVNNPGVAGMTVKVTYDAENLILVGAETTGLFSLAQIASIENANGVITMSFVNIPNVTEDGAFVTLTFAVKDGVEEGAFFVEAELSKSPAGDPEDTGASDYNGEYVELGGSGAMIEIADFIWGDVNNDGIADGADAVLILQYAAGVITIDDLAKPQAGYTNDDDTIDGADAVLIMQYAAGIYTPVV